VIILTQLILFFNQLNKCYNKCGDKMRIGIFVDTYEPYISGVTTSVKMLVETYQEMGHEIFIVTANLKNSKFIYDKENKIIYLPGMKTNLYDIRISGFYSFKAIQIIKEWNLDVIHSHTEFGIGTFARIVRKQLNLPLVHTYHTQYEDYIHYITKGLFDGFSKKIVAGLTKIYGDKTLDALIVPTDKIKDLFRKKYNIKREIHIIPTGIDTNKFILNDNIELNVNKIKEKYNINDNDFVMGSVSRIAKEKNLEFLIKIMPRIIKDNPNTKLMFIGDGPELKSLKKLTAELKIMNNVIFTGKVPYNEIAAYYHTLNVLATASTTETQGLTVIEALAASIPVVCINDPSFTKTIINDYNGFIFNNEMEYFNNIIELIHNQKKYQELTINARNSVYRYSKEAYASEVLKVYAKTIKNYQKKNE